MTPSAGWRATGFGAALFFVVGAQLPYLPVWMEEAGGLTGAQITAVISIATLLRVGLGPLMAAEAERMGLRRMLGRIALVTALGFGALLPDTPGGVIILLTGLIYIHLGIMMPLMEALLVAATRDGWPNYGVSRAISSSAFMAASLAAGALARTFGPEAILYWLIGAALLTALSTLALAPRPKNRPPPLSLPETVRQGFDLFRDRRVLLASLSIALIQSAHAYYYSLGSNVWINQGIGEVHIGALWAVGVGAEVLLLLVSGTLFAGWTPGALLLLGGLGAVMRWTATGFAPGLPMLYAVQTLHAFSFALAHLGGLRFLAEEVRSEKIGVAMSITSAVMFGPLLAALGFITGIYYDSAAASGSVQAQGYWLMAAVAGLGCLCSLTVIRRRQPQSAGEAG